MSLGSGDAGVGSGGNNGAGGAGDGANAGAGGTPNLGAGAGGAGSGNGVGAANGGTAAGSGGTPPSAGVGSGNSGTSSWRDSLPDDLKSDPTLNKYSDLPNLAKAHIELQKKIGQKGIFKPAPNASAEEIKAFREAIGIPTTPDKYDMGKFEGVNIPEPTVEWAKKMGTDLGVEPAAMKNLITEYFKLDAAVKGQEEVNTTNKMKEELGALRKEWGEAYDQNIQRANFAAEKLGGKELIAELAAAKINNSPRLIKALVEASKFYDADKLREGGVSDGRVTPAELEGKIAQVQARLFSMKPTDGAYLSVKNEYESLWRQKTGGK